MLQLNFNPFPILTTDRLTLRELRHSDEQEVYELRKDDEVNRFLAREKAKSIEDARKFITMILQKTRNNESILWAINQKGEDKLIGSIVYYNISAKDYRAEIGYELSPAQQGKGIMQEALEAVIQFGFDKLGFEIIEAWPTKENTRSILLLEKFDFKKEEDDPRLLMADNKGMLLYSLSRISN